MRIRQSDETRLMIVDFPWWLVGFGGLPVVFGIYFLAYKVLGGHGWERDDALTGLVLLGLCIVFGAVPVLLAHRSVFDFDLVQRELRWSRRSLWSRAGGTVPFAEIKGATVSCQRDSDGDKVYCVELSTAKNGILDLASPGSDAWGIIERRCARVAGIINAALQTNGDAALEESILRLAADGQRLAAIQMARKRYGYDLKQAEKFVRELIK